MKKFNIKGKGPLTSLILIIFCFVSIFFGVLFALGQIFAKVQHEKKWSEYDECGIF